MEKDKIEFTELNEAEANDVNLFWNISMGHDSITEKAIESQKRFIKTFGNLSDFTEERIGG